jgi:hypothetical protein
MLGRGKRLQQDRHGLGSLPYFETGVHAQRWDDLSALNPQASKAEAK